MIIYQYDGSLEGYMTAVYNAVNTHQDNALFEVDGDNVQMNLFNEYVHIDTSEDNASEMLSTIKRKVGVRGMSSIYHAFVSADRQKDNIIYRYITLALEHGKKVNEMQSHPHVILFNDIVHKVRGEIHKMSGFVRFVKTSSDIYYAPYSPENDITLYLMREFIDRYPIMRFVLHDVIRGVLGIYNGNDYIIVEDDRPINIKLAEDERFIEQLWSKYYESVNIKERYNRRLMLNYMPKKYVQNVHAWCDFDKNKM